MSDPLSAFVNEEDDIEKYLPDSENAGSGNEQPCLDADNSSPGPTATQSSSSNDTNAQSRPSDLEEKKAADSSDTFATEKDEAEDEAERPCSASSDHSDLLAKIEEEMGNGPKDLDVSVDNPEKIIKTMESYIAFTVKTKTTRSDFEDPEYVVMRRYNDFLWLRQQLEDKNPALIIPPLPEKHNLTVDRFDKDFVRFRQVALDRFMARLAQHPIMSQDEILQAFLTIDAVEFQVYKKRGTGLLSRVSKSLSTMGGSFMLKNRGEEYDSIYDYANSLGEKLGAFERITSRVASELNDYLTALSGYPPAFDKWSTTETDLSGNISEMSKLMSSIHDQLEAMGDETTLKTLLPAKEYVLFSESIKSVLARRDALQHEHEVVTEELVKCKEEKDQLESATPGTGGFLSRGNTEEAKQAKTEKLTARITELDSAHRQCKARLDERNLQLKTDLERWHINKKADIKELINGMASRHIDTYDKHISSLEFALNSLKATIGR